MTDETMESSSVSGNVETPNPAVSKQDDKPTSAFDADQLLKQVEVLIEKKVQSVKDRRFDEMDKRLGGAEAVLERVKDLIPAEKFNELKKDLEFEDLKRRVYGEEPKPVAMASAAIDVAKVASEYGLKADDPEFVAAFSNRKYDNDKDARLDLVTFAYKKATKPQPSDADAASPPAGGIKQKLSPSEVEAKAATLNALYRSPTKNAKQIAALEQELEPYLP